MSLQTLGTTKVPILGEMTFGCNLHEEAQNILSRGEWCLLPKVVIRAKLVVDIVLINFVTSLPYNLQIVFFS